MWKLKKDPMVFQKDLFERREELTFFLFTIFFDKKQKAIQFLLNCNKKALFVSENSETGISEIWELSIKHYRKKCWNFRQSEGVLLFDSPFIYFIFLVNHFRVDAGIYCRLDGDFMRIIVARNGTKWFLIFLEQFSIFDSFLIQMLFFLYSVKILVLFIILRRLSFRSGDVLSFHDFDVFDVILQFFD